MREQEKSKMTVVRPFRCIRPDKKEAKRVAALPYDVYNRAEALEEVRKEPLSFLKIDRAETQFPDHVGMYEDCVYEKARETLERMRQDGTFIQDETPSYYLYELTMDGRSQTGIVACASVDDYLNNVIKKHENTREEKELDRIRHVDVTDAHTGPIFLTYRPDAVLDRLVEETKGKECLYDFTSGDGVRHRVWIVDEPERVEAVGTEFSGIPAAYIADGHHRAASAVKVALKRREEHPGYTGEEEFNYFLSVLFPSDQLMILPYNRVVRDLNGLTKEEFLEKAARSFLVSKRGAEAFAPGKKGEFGLYLEGEWYTLEAREEILSNDPVRGLDVSLLQDYLLGPVLGIGDPRTDKRIDFIGGIRGLEELEYRAGHDMKAAFSVYPTSIGELLTVADAGLLMPPKSTWFEPKLRSGLFIHSLI